MKRKLLIVALSLQPIIASAETSLESIDVEAQSEQDADRKVQDSEALQRQASGQTLGDYLDNTPNVDSASYGAGVGRPVVRGMSGYRVKILQNDLEASDLSAMSPDHAVGVSAKASQRIELLKGPASLLYGAQAGGVVRLVDEAAADFPKQGISGKLEASATDSNEGRNLSGQVSAASEKFGISFSGVHQQTGDYVDGNGQTIKDSDVLSQQGQVNLFYRYAPDTQLQFYFRDLYKDYGIPNSTAEETRISMERQDYGVKWSKNALNDAIDRLSMELQYSDYLHDETEGGRKDGLFGKKTLTFDLTMDYAWQDWLGTAKFGVSNQELKVCHEHGGCESFTTASRNSGPIGDSIENNMTTYGLPYSHGHPMPDTEERRWYASTQADKPLNETDTLSLGAYMEYRTLDADPSNIQQTWVYPTSLDANYYDSAQDWAGSLSAAFKRDWDQFSGWEASLSYLQRLPSADELYWNGFHHATDSYIFGNRYLNKEQAITLDLDWHGRLWQGDWQASAFYYAFKDYIYQRTVYDAGGQPLLDPFHTSEVWMMLQDDARFYGGSVSYGRNLGTAGQSPWRLNSQIDILYAKLSDGSNLPRTAPASWLVGLDYQQTDWQTNLSLKHVFEATELAKYETATPGYNWLSFYAQKDLKGEQSQWSLWFKADNILDEYAQNHLSFLKDTAPLSGRQLSVGVRWQYR
ncbi:TonB-dependent receptor [Thiomicrorhabdus heinhorstiae]|uniref:TonB-dependent receptor n=1 Tax=Thiomicrorhabdus heinhorstiae TaxID=2748010 RepID=A0ABS0BWC6_9GAMM|nr:TonB-dependent receptor [Thiomicrorhabdus heinhorstiae]MBF6058110.1 TonB-dependent receptor [Thiomicrorhabdus heinhorstiae]